MMRRTYRSHQLFLGLFLETDKKLQVALQNKHICFLRFPNMRDEIKKKAGEEKYEK
jgi:hypothetical protein